jgi:hypothetical protein
MSDFPFHTVASEAEKKMNDGFTIYQKFTCDHCGTRQTMAEPNSFFCTGKCERCGKITNILARGCNYIAMIGAPILH